MIDGAPPPAAAGCFLRRPGRTGQLNKDIITYLGNLSIYNYKWFGCCGIEEGKVETRNVKVETGRAERVKPRTLCKTNPQRVRHPGRLSALRVVHPAYSFAPTGNARFLS